MPKVLVLVADTETPGASLANIVAEAAKAVRFTEVDVRAAALQATTGTRTKMLESPVAAEHYDGVVIVGSGAAMPPAIELVFDAWDRTDVGAFANTVFATVGFESSLVLERIAGLGGIVVSEPRGEADPAVRAKLLGQRVAKVVEWVRHALSHEPAERHPQHHHHAH